MKLTDPAVKNAAPKEKQYTLYDSEGLFLLVMPNGSKLWRWKYRVGGVERRTSLGVYPKVSLRAARLERDRLQTELKKGVDPAVEKQALKAVERATGETFQLIAEEWHKKFRHTWADNTAKTVIERLQKDIFPYIGARPIREITPPELLAVIRRIESRGAVETARRDLQKCGEIFRYALATGRAERDIAADLRGAIAPPKKRHFASIHEPKEIGELLRAIDGYQGSPVTRCALQLAPLTFVRPGELRHAEWTEIDLEAEEWRIPAARMKMREKHIVPLSRQALEVLHELQPLTGGGRYVFPGARSADRPMSENAVLAALRRMGYEKGEMTGHGFRSMASTILHEQGWLSDVVERQLAHGDRNKVRASYNFAQHLPERRKMMQAWADYLEELRSH
ncbi:MAG TPA: tyrosine-type recombinase/integrase [Humidesulfovibrio sp.]|uniref:tyrosine-type recombinase/integrase n=1 Tax=Humidesulfovibrio sp. TaxID=2910988 RepID=UPI002CE5BF5B|nr:tyrosine-type recombinase/integrase [Humidesulfovibrio sp.]HWR03663.1 tyrosine-type recombinase/integrase [Humidesulfovibrio sp.]